MREFLDRGADIAQMAPWPDRGDSCFHALFCHFDKPLRLLGHLANAKHAARVRVVAMENRRAVHIDDVAVFQNPVIVRDAVAHLSLMLVQQLRGKPS